MRTHATPRAGAGTAICPWCRDTVAAGPACGCGVVYHEECLGDCTREHGRCAVYGCRAFAGPPGSASAGPAGSIGFAVAAALVLGVLVISPIGALTVLPIAVGVLAVTAALASFVAIQWALSLALVTCVACATRAVHLTLGIKPPS